MPRKGLRFPKSERLLTGIKKSVPHGSVLKLDSELLKAKWRVLMALRIYLFFLEKALTIPARPSTLRLLRASYKRHQKAYMKLRASRVKSTGKISEKSWKR